MLDRLNWVDDYRCMCWKLLICVGIYFCLNEHTYTMPTGTVFMFMSVNKDCVPKLKFLNLSECLLSELPSSQIGMFDK